MIGIRPTIEGEIMAVRLNPHLNFTDDARQAMEFYQSVFGGELAVNTFGEFQASQDPAEQNKIMHAQLEAPNGLVLMAADTPAGMDRADASNITISLSGGMEDETDLRGYWEKLSGSGQVVMPLELAPWGDYFGLCTDRFGTAWMVDFGPAQPPQ
jgi:PhnB protein